MERLTMVCWVQNDCALHSRLVVDSMTGHFAACHALVRQVVRPNRMFWSLASNLEAIRQTPYDIVQQTDNFHAREFLIIEIRF